MGVATHAVGWVCGLWFSSDNLKIEAFSSRFFQLVIKYY